MYCKKLFLIVCFLLCSAHALFAAVDTLGTIGERNLNGNTARYVSILRHFSWDVTKKDKDGHIKSLTTRRADTVFEKNGTDTTCFSTSFYVADSLRNKIYVLHYELEGSVHVTINGKDFLSTGLFQPNASGKSRLLEQDDFKDFVFTDSIQQVQIVYLPYRNSGVHNLSLKIDKLAAAEMEKEDMTSTTNNDFQLGMFYLAFAIVFLILFIFFQNDTENLYFAMFCLFGALSFLWAELHTDLLFNLEPFLGVFCFEFLAIFFYKILRNKEKSKVPLVIISAIMLICFLPPVRFHTDYILGSPVPVILFGVYIALYAYAFLSAIVSLIRGIGQKQWEARIILLFCLVPFVLFILLMIVLIVSTVIEHGKISKDFQDVFNLLFKIMMKGIIYLYPLAAAFILGRRNRLNQKRLTEQVASIQRLSDENLAKEQEKKEILEGQKEALEREVALRTAEVVHQKEEIELQHKELKVEKKKSDDLLLNILPEEVAQELKEKGTSEAKLFDNVTVLFADFVAFTQAGEHMTPHELVGELHVCFRAYDEIISRYGIEKIKTIGDAYLAVGGLPQAQERHAQNVVNAAIEISNFMQARHSRMGDKTFRVRIGIHSGSVVGGIVGVKKFAYDIWGDTVNTAARMEQNSEAGKINISQSTYALVQNDFECTYRGEIEAKNKGMMRMYFVAPVISS